MTAPDTPSAATASEIKAATTATCALVAFALACLAHEVLGHGGTCLASGGRIATMTSSLFACRPGTLLADLGGPAANLGLGVTSLLASRGRRPGRVAHLGLAFLAAFNLFWFASGLLQSAIWGTGDFAYFQRLYGGAMPQLRKALGVVGACVGALACRQLGQQPIARSTYWLGYAVAAIAACGSALASGPLIEPAMREAALESLAAMAWLWLIRPRPRADTPMLAATPTPASRGEGISRRALVLAAVLATATLALLGHGVRAD